MLSRCMTGDQWAPAGVRALGFYDIPWSTLPHHRDQGTQFWTRPCTVRRMRHNALMWREDAMTRMGFLMRVCSRCLYHVTQSGVSVFRHGDGFVMLSMRQQQKECQEQLSVLRA